MIVYRGKSGFTINRPVEPIWCEGCSDFKIIGGPEWISGWDAQTDGCNVLLHECRDFLVSGLRLANPIAGTNPGGKHVLADKCSRGTFERLTGKRSLASGDGFNDHDGDGNAWRDIKCVGPMLRSSEADPEADDAVPFVIDGLKARGITLSGITAIGSAPPWVTVRSGDEHEISGCKGLIQVSYPENDGRVVTLYLPDLAGLRMIETASKQVVAGRMWAWKPHVRQIVQGARPRQTAPSPKRPAGWSLKKFMAWLKRRTQ